MEIEKNVPMPEKVARKKESGEVKALLLSMEIGDSVLIKDGNTRTSKKYQLARQVGVRNGIKFSGRTIDETSCRVWRVE